MRPLIALVFFSAACGEETIDVLTLAGDYEGNGRWEKSTGGTAVIVDLHLAPNEDELIGTVTATGAGVEAIASIVVEAVEPGGQLNLSVEDCDQEGSTVVSCPFGDTDSADWVWDEADTIAITSVNPDESADRIQVDVQRD